MADGHELAVVLGAGGTAAWAYHLGIAATLAEQGLPLTGAPVVVGTSAGAAIAASLLGGSAPDDVLDAIADPPDPARRRAYLAEMRAANRGRSWLPTAPHLLRELLPGGAGLGVAWAGLAPPGFFPSSSLTGFPGLEALDVWPPALRVVAVRLDTGERVVFGPDRTDVDVATSVAASQSVPLLFAPTEVDGVLHVDGATRSSTHADVVLSEDAGQVLVVAPMCRPGGRAARRLARRALRDEVARLERGGVRVLLVRPGPDLDGDMGRVRDATVARRVADAGRRDAARVLARAGLG